MPEKPTDALPTQPELRRRLLARGSMVLTVEGVRDCADLGMTIDALILRLSETKIGVSPYQKGYLQGRAHALLKQIDESVEVQ
jgi:hypothetical protein